MVAPVVGSERIELLSGTLNLLGRLRCTQPERKGGSQLDAPSATSSCPYIGSGIMVAKQEGPDPADKNGERGIVFIPGGKKYKGQWVDNKITGEHPPILAPLRPPRLSRPQPVPVLTPPPARNLQAEAP